MYRILTLVIPCLPAAALASTDGPPVSSSEQDAAQLSAEQLFPIATTSGMAPQLSDGIGRLLRQEATDGGTSSEGEVSGGRDYMMEVGFRGRFLSVPRTIMDIWFFNEEDPGWAYTEPRPNLRGYSLGLEFVVKGESANGIFYFDYVDSQMNEGYWDDVEEPADHLDGDYLKPSDNLGLVAIGANYAYELHMVRTEQTSGYFGLSFLVGGGLGVAFMVGEVEQWVPDDNGNPSYKLYLEGEPPSDEKRIPPIYPMVDINAGLRFNFGDRAVLRVEGGLHTLLFYGATLGIMF